MIRAYLTTKLHIPPLRPHSVTRSRLDIRLSDALQHYHRLTVISAPAGTGKTTLVNMWVQSQGQRTVWLSLDHNDDDPLRFLTLLLAGMQQIEGSAGTLLEQMISTPQLPPIIAFVPALINELVAIAADKPLVLVFDDYHTLTSPLIHNFMEQLLDYLPSAVHVILLTRSELPLKLARLRARGQITELHDRDLRFTPEETEQFLTQTINLQLSTSAIRSLATITEGWIAGLQMAALTVQQEPEHADILIAEFAGGDRFVEDYLVSEVLEQQPAEIRSFLLDTAILDRFCASLCDAVTGRQGSAALLEYLDKANLFVTPLDYRRTWYRYHTLFVEFLRNQLTSEQRTVLHRRAAQWYAQSEIVAPAIEHALMYGKLSDDFTLAAQLISTHAESIFLGGALQTLGTWFDALPEGHILQDYQLVLYRCATYALQGDNKSAHTYAQIVEAAANEESPTQQGKHLALFSFVTLIIQQDYRQVIASAQESLKLLGNTQPHWQVMALWSMAEAYERISDIKRSIDTLRAALPIAEHARNWLFFAVIEVALVIALRYHGKRAEALTACKHGIAVLSDHRGQVSPLAGTLMAHLALLQFEAHEVDAAHASAQQSRALSEKLGLTHNNEFCQALIAPIIYHLGDTALAFEWLQEAIKAADHSGITDSSFFAGIAWELQLQQGDVESVARAMHAAGYTPEMPITYAQIDSQMVYAHVLIASEALSEAQDWLTKLEQFIIEKQLYGLRIKLDLLVTRWALATGERGMARGHLLRAIQAAAVDSYLQPFITAPHTIHEHLATMRKYAPAFIDQVLNAAHMKAAPAKNTLANSILSEREQEVLALIHAGLSNGDIAARLFISLATVKRHINHIYNKLGAKNRTEAIQKAHLQQLLPP